MKKSIIALFFTLAFLGQARAQLDFNVPLLGVGNVALNPGIAYGRTIRWFFAPGGTIATINIDGVTYSRDLVPVILEAIQEWRVQLTGTNIVLEPAADISRANLIFEWRNSVATDDTDPLAIANTRYDFLYSRGTISLNSPTRIAFLHDRIQNFFNNPAYRFDTPNNLYTRNPAFNLPSGMPLVAGGGAGLLDYVLKMVAKHELGHVMGLAHPTDRNEPFIRIADAPVQAEIMARVDNQILANFMVVRHNEGNPRPLTRNDVAISQAEGEAVRAVNRGQQPSCSSSCNGTIPHDEL